VRILCVIPVRGGSKGLPRKNAAEIVEGVSLLEWTIRQGLASYPVGDVVVSTEDLELAGIAQNCGVLVATRPAELAQDETTTAAVVDNLLAQLDPDAELFDAIAILQVTSPLRQVSDIRRSIEMISSGAYESVVSAYQTMVCHPAKLYFLDESQAMPTAVPVAPELQRARRQDLPKAYRRNGAIFIVTREYYEKTGQLWGGCTGLVVMPESRSIDIDTPADLLKARQILVQANTEAPQ
jgi:CMP-N,N'-diacetyllegionaminic acid synthase